MTKWLPMISELCVEPLPTPASQEARALPFALVCKLLSADYALKDLKGLNAGQAGELLKGAAE